MKTEKIVLFLLLLLCGINLMAQEDLLKTEYSYKRYTTKINYHISINECLIKNNKNFIGITVTPDIIHYPNKTFAKYIEKCNIFSYCIEKKGDFNFLQPHPIFEKTSEFAFLSHQQDFSFHLSLSLSFCFVLNSSYVPV